MTFSMVDSAILPSSGDDFLFNANDGNISMDKPSTNLLAHNGDHPGKKEKISRKKRKADRSTDRSKERKKKKKSKPNASHKRRNIRSLLTTDRLQDDTLSALKAEQDRLKRLEETTDIHLPHPPIQTHVTDMTQPQTTTDKPVEQDCIVLGDDDEDIDPTASNTIEHSDEQSTTKGSNEILDENADSNDSDVQCVDSDTEVVNDKLTRKLRQLHVDDRINVPDKNGRIQVNINHPANDPDLFVPDHLCSILKPHQIGGIRFMYDNIVESLQRLQTSRGLGCILAHSMGCGKTIQVIAFIDVLLRHSTAKSVLIVVPINTIQNWLTEFNRWCPVDHPTIAYKRSFQLYILNETSKKFTQRAKIVQNWTQTGGTLILGYEMFRLMVIKKPAQANASNKMSNGNKTPLARAPTPVIVDLEEEEKNFETMEDIRNALLNSDLVICDEGHRIKNHQAGVAQALKSIQTQRRIVLTGYPLQNNLIEYWCMVDFVRPNYLGSKVEFCNMFERPILNGQCIDSTVEDGKIMRARAHVLHSLLEGFIQRRGHDVLRSDLPPKTEYVILLKLSPSQRQLYMKFLEAVGALSNTSEKTLNPLRAFAICCKIWNHPDVLHKFVRDRQDGADLDLDFELEQNSTKLALAKSKSKTSVTNGNDLSTMLPPIEKKEFDYDFANGILNSYVCGQLINGIKFQIALTILDLSLRVGDKVLIFSQSLLSLNKLEEFLHQRQLPDSEQKWEKNLNYYRLDGGTSGLERERLINAFNAPNSNAKLFLLSTRAGCLGINLIAANRVIVMDVSWNPCLDAQAVCRVYRYGQRKHCYIYRLIADFTMEKRIYDRQIAKQGMSDRVVDELQPQNQFTRNEVENLLHFAMEEEPAAVDLLAQVEETTDDPVLKATCEEYAQSITKVPFTHESLLSDRKEYQLTSAEKRRAEKEYHEEKRMNTFSYRSRMTTSRSLSRLLPDYDPRTAFHPSPSLESRLASYQPLRSNIVPMAPLPHHIQQQSNDRKLEQLQQHGISVQPIVLRSPLEVQLNASERDRIPAGVQVHLIQAPRGSYIRTPDGKFFAIRQPSSSLSASASNSKALPMAPPPPPPLPAPPLSNAINSFLYDSPSSLSNSTSSLLNDINNLNEELEHLIDDTSSNTSVPSSSSSAFENLSSWHNDYFQQPSFYSDLLSADTRNFFASSPPPSVPASTSTASSSATATAPKPNDVETDPVADDAIFNDLHFF